MWFCVALLVVNALTIKFPKLSEDKSPEFLIRGIRVRFTKSCGVLVNSGEVTYRVPLIDGHIV